MDKIYTDRGKSWEMKNSWWVLLTFVPFGIISFIAFLYTGSKVKNQRWRLYGFVYLAVLIIAFAIAVTGIGAAVALTLWIVTIIHAFKIRPAYLVQLDVLKNNEQQMANQEITKLREEAEAKFKVDRQAKTNHLNLKLIMKKLLLVSLKIKWFHQRWRNLSPLKRG